MQTTPALPSAQQASTAIATKGAASIQQSSYKSSAEKLKNLFLSGTCSGLTGMDLAKELPEVAQLSLLAVQRDATLAVAINAIHTRDLIRTESRGYAMKLVCAVLKMASLSLNLSQTMTPIQVFETAQLFLDKYPTDSVTDLVLCLKMLKSNDLIDLDGKPIKVYNQMNIETISKWMTAYSYQKAEYLENERRKEASSHKIAAKGLFLNADELSPEALEIVSSVKKSLLKPTPALQTFSDSDYYATLEHQLPTMPEEAVRELLAESRRKHETVVEQMAQTELVRRRENHQTQMN